MRYYNRGFQETYKGGNKNAQQKGGIMKHIFISVLGCLVGTIPLLLSMMNFSTSLTCVSMVAAIWLVALPTVYGCKDKLSG